ncbi:hypothetical protein [Bradyrhizobium icense]|uniref:hypothetical protein n=1 Tax=Bradyrhizobium icense TaxID=1274631 RepID=UPI0012EADC9C
MKKRRWPRSLGCIDRGHVYCARDQQAEKSPSENGSGSVPFRVANPVASSYPMGMNRSDQFRKNAENCELLSETTDDLPARRRYRRMAEAWNALALEQAWLDGEVTDCQIADDGCVEQADPLSSIKQVE